MTGSEGRPLPIDDEKAGLCPAMGDVCPVRSIIKNAYERSAPRSPEATQLWSSVFDQQLNREQSMGRLSCLEALKAGSCGAYGHSLAVETPIGDLAFMDDYISEDEQYHPSEWTRLRKLATDMGIHDWSKKLADEAWSVQKP